MSGSGRPLELALVMAAISAVVTVVGDSDWRVATTAVVARPEVQKINVEEHVDRSFQVPTASCREAKFCPFDNSGRIDNLGRLMPATGRPRRTYVNYDFNPYSYLRPTGGIEPNASPQAY